MCACEWPAEAEQSKPRKMEIAWLGFLYFSDIDVTLLQLPEFIEPFSEAESAPIRSAVKFYFDIDVRIFPTFF